jgi:hypothetical protein
MKNIQAGYVHGMAMDHTGYPMCASVSKDPEPQWRRVAN